MNFVKNDIFKVDFLDKLGIFAAVWNCGVPKIIYQYYSFIDLFTKEMERERKRKEEEEKRLKEAEAERKLKAEMEAKRKVEEEAISHALEADRRAARELQEKLNEENRKLREQIGILCPVFWRENSNCLEK